MILPQLSYPAILHLTPRPNLIQIDEICLIYVQKQAISGVFWGWQTQKTPLPGRGFMKQKYDELTGSYRPKGVIRYSLMTLISSAILPSSAIGSAGQDYSLRPQRCRSLLNRPPGFMSRSNVIRMDPRCLGGTYGAGWVGHAVD
jgi:hypothetical protein